MGGKRSVLSVYSFLAFANTFANTCAHLFEITFFLADYFGFFEIKCWLIV